MGNTGSNNTANNSSGINNNNNSGKNGYQTSPKHAQNNSSTSPPSPHTSHFVDFDHEHFDHTVDVEPPIPEEHISKIPTMFRWPYGGKKVYIVGTFNGWRERIPMQYNHDERCFIVILNIPSGTHKYRFIVDGEHKIDPHQSSVNDENNNLNNIIDIELPEEDEKDEYSSMEETTIGSYDVMSMGSFGKSPLSTSGPQNGGYSPATFLSTSEMLGQSPSKFYQQHQGNISKSVDSSHKLKKRQQQQISMQQYQEEKYQLQQEQYKIAYSGGQSLDVPSVDLMNKQPSGDGLDNHQHTSGGTSGPNETKETVQSSGYGQKEQEFPENKKTMPLLPPHLRYTPLNATVNKKYPYMDPSLLPIPLHVTVNHVYFYDRPNVRMIGFTQRYKEKFSTIVLYKPNKQSNGVSSPSIPDVKSSVSVSSTMSAPSTSLPTFSSSSSSPFEINSSRSTDNSNSANTYKDASTAPPTKTYNFNTIFSEKARPIPQGSASSYQRTFNYSNHY